MLNRLTISALLKSVIAVMAACVVAFLIATAWDSWGRLQSAARISVIAEASGKAFKAMHNLRTDRSTTNRLLNGGAPLDTDIEKYLRSLRDAEMPGMSNALTLFGKIEFPQQQTLVPEFDRLFLIGMIKHHQGAIDMVDVLFKSYGAAQDETVFKFASDVYADQSTEIDRMNKMLDAGGRR